MALEYLIRTVGSVKVVDCRGRIVLGEETAKLRELLKDLLRPSARIVLDLTHVNHIDSNGIGMLVGVQVTAKNASAVIKLAGLAGHVRSVMEATRLLTLFESYATAEEAAASFAPATG